MDAKKTLTVFEYQKVCCIPDRYWNPDKSDLLRIERLNSLFKNKIIDVVVKEGRPVVNATSYVGILKIGKTTLQILPKVDKENEDKEKLATRNLLYLLSYTKKLPVKESDIAHLTEKQTDFFEILIYLFAKNLWDLIRKGMYKEYVTQEEYTGFLKGKWLISQQLTQRPTNRHCFYVSYDDFTEDNSFNKIFKYAVILLQKISTNVKNQQLLLELSFALNDIEFEKITKEHFSGLNINRLNRQYQPVLELARLFILYSSLQMTVNNIETFSFVFDMNKLFEEFVYEFIRRHRDEILPDDLKDCDIKAQSGNKYLVYTEDSNPVFKLQPDIMFIKPDGSVPLIIDTKYKLLDPQDKNNGISQSDMYQMFAYAKKYDCDRVVLLYPHREGVEEKRFKLEEKEGQRRICINTINIGIDLSREKQTLLQQIKNILGG